jgi:predicted dehydrogenase
MRVIQVGVGGFGTVWVNVLKADPRVQVVGLVDVNPKALEEACATGGYSRQICFGTLEEALRKAPADAVVSSTPPRFHRHDVVTALRAGLHALSEKPMADTLADCRAMLTAARATGRVYAVSQNYRYNPAMWTLAKVVHERGLGAIGQVKLDFYLGIDFGGGFRHEMPYPLVIDMSIHHFDLLRFVTGLDAVSVRAFSWNPPWSNYKGDASSMALFEMSSGARVLYSASWCAKGQHDDWNGSWQIECERGTISYRQGRITIHHAPGLYKVESVEEVPLEPLEPKAQAFVLDDFIQAVTEGRRPRTDVFDNIRSVAMVFATVAAMESGRPKPVLDAATKKLLE